MVERLIGLRPIMTELTGKRYYSKSIYAPLAAGLRFIKPLKRVTMDSKNLLRHTQIQEQLALSSALKGVQPRGPSIMHRIVRIGAPDNL